MANMHQVFDTHRRNPSWNSARIAEALHCDSAYVRATFYRAGLPAPGKRGLPENVRRERERCAGIAERLGSPVIASEIMRAN